MHLIPIETNIAKRREKGIEHNPESEQIVKAVAELDFNYGNFFSFKIGKDGDKSEYLVYLLDIYFEQREEEQKKRKAEFYKEQEEKCRRLTRDLDPV